MTDNLEELKRRGLTPLDNKLNHKLLDVFREGSAAFDSGAQSPYHGHSLEHCLHSAGWVQRDLRVALDKANASLIATAREVEGLRAAHEDLGEALFYLSDKLRGSGFLSDEANRAAYEAVVAAFAALEGAEAPQSPIPLELKPIHFRLLERGANSRYIGLSNNSGVRMGEHAALGQLMRAGLVRFTEDSQPPGPRMPTPCEITDAGRAALEGKGG